ncbi:MAG TPA: hypothetical protein VK524_27845 [Polyangiaceae bacterium]|nr:hypothetical protein [Polyangiaceae bacterium]
MTPLSKPSRAHVASRVVAGILGSYVFAWGFITLTVASAVALGLPYGEAQSLAYLLVFLVLLSGFCWAIAAPSLVRVWVVLCGGGALMIGSGWAVSRFFV